MPYLIETFDKPDSAEVRMANRPEHVAYLKANVSKLLAAGAKLSDDGETMLGSFYIVDTDDRAEAERFLEGDPFTKAGLPARVEIVRWRKAFFGFEDFTGSV